MKDDVMLYLFLDDWCVLYVTYWCLVNIFVCFISYSASNSTLCRVIYSSLFCDIAKWCFDLLLVAVFIECLAQYLRSGFFHSKRHRKYSICFHRLHEIIASCDCLEIVSACNRRWGEVWQLASMLLSLGSSPQRIPGSFKYLDIILTIF